MIEAIRAMAQGDIDEALRLVESYLEQLVIEETHAKESIKIVEELLQSERTETSTLQLKRSEAAAYLDISVDSLRNWELNGLLDVKRSENNYRIYTEEDQK